jgi:hypothetical protein
MAALQRECGTSVQSLKSRQLIGTKYSRAGTMDSLKQFEDRENSAKNSDIYYFSNIFSH